MHLQDPAMWAIAAVLIAAGFYFRHDVAGAFFPPPMRARPLEEQIAFNKWLVSRNLRLLVLIGIELAAIVAVFLASKLPR